MNDTITAYHGSPHDFEQFDTSKIGTGEGAQAYGHGLYFAEHEPVAEGYRNRLTDHPPNQVIFPNGDGNRYHPDSLDDPVDKAAAKALLTYSSSKGYKDYLRRAPIEPETAVAAMKLIKNKEIISAPAGHMYEVAIDAHPDHMLDWDKPLSEQSPHIVKSIFDAQKDNPTLFNVFKPHLEKDSTGMGFYQSLATHHPNGYQGASEFLQRAGIHGIRYLDANSRGASGQPTHNYVVFDHNRVKVNRKYEQGGTVEAYGDGGTTHEPHKRAEEQGYSIKGYHVTRGNRSEKIASSRRFDPSFGEEHGEPATFFWDNPNAANEWVHSRVGLDWDQQSHAMSPRETDRLDRYAPTIMPVRIHPGVHAEVDWPQVTGRDSYHGGTMQKLLQHAKSQGVDTLRIKNMDEFGTRGEKPHDQIAVLNPSMIRSEFAQFDPARQHENDIGARKGGTINREKVDYKNATHSPIVEHVLGKISAPLPALNPHLTAAIAGRRS
jgi:hypothetical protein